MTKKMDLLKRVLEVGAEKPTKDVYMKRFEDHFKVQAIDYKELQRVREQATFPGKRKGDADQLDERLFGMLILEKGLLEPNFSDSSVVAKYGTATDAIETLLLPGEISRLSGEVMALSGFAEEEEDEIKN